MTPDLSELNLPTLKNAILTQFTCLKSGNCCRREGVVYASLGEINRMAQTLGINPDAFIKRYTLRENGWYVLAKKGFRDTCFLNNKNECDIYEARPGHCRTYPYWSELWESKESILEELSLCPGLQKAFQKVTAEALANPAPHKPQTA